MEKELEINNRKLSPKEQENLRLKIIRVAKKNLKANGKPDVKAVSEICECGASHVKMTWKKYCEGGISAVKAVTMGRPRNSGKLTVAQQNEIKKLIVDKNPDQLKLPGFLWDRENVRSLIKRLFKEDIALQNISVYLNKWGFSPQRPLKRNYKQDSAEVKKWLNKEYPAIKRRAKKENAEIAWSDETGCQNECNYARGYAPIGQTPVMPVGNDKLRINMISAITNQGKLRFMFYRSSMNARVLIKFMSRLIKETSRKIFLILDNLKSHHAKIVEKWLAKHSAEIEVFYLPSYSPEYNPDEYLNGNLKREMSKKGYSKTVDELESKARGTMKTFQYNAGHVANFFKAKYVKYAA